MKNNEFVTQRLRFQSDFERQLQSSFFFCCDFNRGQRGERDAAASPRCDPMRGQRGKQNAGVDGELHLGPSSSLASSSSAPSVAGDRCDSLGAGRGAGLRSSASSMPGFHSSRITSKTLSSTCSSPGTVVFGRGAEARLSAGVACTRF